MRYAIGLLLSCALVGCGGAAWIRPANMTPDQAQRAAYECQRDAAMISLTGNPWVDGSARRNIFYDCMTSKGFKEDTGPLGGFWSWLLRT